MTTFPAAAALSAIRACAPFRSRYDARPILTDLHVEYDGTSATIVATDTYRIVVVEIERQGPERKSRTLDIPASVVNRAMKLWPRGAAQSMTGDLTIIQTERPAEEVGKKDHVIRSVSMECGGVVLSGETDRSGPYPKWRKATETGAESSEPTAFNPGFLVDLNVFSREVGTFDPRVVVASFYGSQKPAHFEVRAPKIVKSARMILMPVRVA